MTDLRTASRDRRARGGAAAGGFTLMEMLVVIGLVALMATMALPSIVTLYNSGADAQAYNLISAMLTASRALAIERVTFAGVHWQLADARSGGRLIHPELEDTCYVAMVAYDEDKKHFNVASSPQQVPGGFAYGAVTSGIGGQPGTVSGENYDGGAEDPQKFTTATVVFTAFGSAVKTANGETVLFNVDDKTFYNQDPNVLLGSTKLWELDEGYSQKRYAVTALTLFNMGDYLAAPNRKGFLNDNAQFLPMNVHTGQLFPRE